VTDIAQPVILGLRCRECLAEHLKDPDVLITCAWRDGPGPHKLHVRTGPLHTFYPQPNVYRHVARSTLENFAKDFAGNRCQAVPQEVRGLSARKLYEAAFEAARDRANPSAASGTSSRAVPFFHVHAVEPVYGAGALFDDDDIVTCATIPAESGQGCAVDASLQLVVLSQKRNKPKLLLVCDQWGVLHAPSAAGRGHLLAAFGSQISIANQPEAAPTTEICLSLEVTGASFGLGFRNHCVETVIPGSPADVAGVQVGDTITAVNKDRVNMVPDAAVLQMVKASVGVLKLTVRRTLKACAETETARQASPERGAAETDGVAVIKQHLTCAVPDTPSSSTVLLIHEAASGHLREILLDDLAGKMPDAPPIPTVRPRVPPASPATSANTCVVEQIASADVAKQENKAEDVSSPPLREANC